MPSDPTTAAELHALVAQWPEEAREMDLEYAPEGAKRYSQTYDEARPIKNARWELEGEPISVRHAIDLHVASGIRWLLTEAFVVRSYATHQNGRTRIVLYGSGARSRKWNIETPFEAPTLFLATHAAIVAAKESST